MGDQIADAIVRELARQPDQPRQFHRQRQQADGIEQRLAPPRRQEILGRQADQHHEGQMAELAIGIFALDAVHPRHHAVGAALAPRLQPLDDMGQRIGAPQLVGIDRVAGHQPHVGVVKPDRSVLADVQGFEQELDVVGADGRLGQTDETAVRRGQAAAENHHPLAGDARRDGFRDHQPGLGVGFLAQEVIAVANLGVGQGRALARAPAHLAVSIHDPQAERLRLGDAVHAPQQIPVGGGTVRRRRIGGHLVGIVARGLAQHDVDLFHRRTEMPIQQAGQVVGIAEHSVVFGVARRLEVVAEQDREAAPQEQQHGGHQKPLRKGGAGLGGKCGGRGFGRHDGERGHLAEETRPTQYHGMIVRDRD